MQKKNQTKTIKQVLLFILLIIIVLLIIFAEDILKLHNKILDNNIELAKATYTTTIAEIEYPIDDAVTDTPNSPVISAGMIPVKWDGTNWVITTKDDENWYDYENGKPAYIMLNDGTYQSELIRDMTGKKLSNENIGTKIQTSELGKICLWFPRFAYNNAGEILYIKQGYKVVGTWNVPEVFTYVTTKMDFSLAGVWLEYNDEIFQTTRVIEMNNEEGKYGFIANTKASVIEANDRIELQKYITYLNQKSNGNSNNIKISDININLERAIIKITNAEKREAIKASAKYSNGKIIVTVEYCENGISEIIDVVNKEKLEVKEGSLVADTGTTPIGNCTYEFVIIDNEGIQRKVEVTVSGLDVYIIRDKATLYAFRDAVNAGLTSATTKAYQVADVSVNNVSSVILESGQISMTVLDTWIPIADYATDKNLTYAGTYDGQGHRVTGLYKRNSSGVDYIGFFGTLSGTVKNLEIAESHFDNSSTTNASACTGGIVANLNNGGTIDNCCNSAIVKGYNNSGGIVGYADTTSAINIKNCNNNGYVRGAGNYAGGIIGYKTGAGNLTITNCNNYGAYVGGTKGDVGGIVGLQKGSGNLNLTNCSNNTGYLGGGNNVGGIVGSREDNGSLIITNCNNKGNISVGGTNVGGIIGYKHGAGNLNLTNCKNEGSILGSSYLRVGGILGYKSGCKATITNCSNNGAVTAKDAVGGIVGRIENTSTNITTITGCYNEGKITGTGNDSTSPSAPGKGGIVGYADTNYTTIKNCYNTGNINVGSYNKAGGITGSYGIISNCYNSGIVSGNTNIGGICGKTGGTISYCYNEGAITGTANYVGGIVGEQDRDDNVTYCFNTGNIKGASYVGGIVGDSAATILDTYNTGNVTATDYVGGICGRTSWGINTSYNLGSNVTGTANTTYVGGIAGAVTSSDSGVYTCYNLSNISGSKYLGGIVGHLNSNSQSVKYSYNLGTVGSSSSNTYVGGIVGNNYGSSSITSVTKCVNAGKTNGASASTGAIVGYNSSTSYTGLTGCSYLKGTATYASGRAKKDDGARAYATIGSLPTIISTLDVYSTKYYKTDTNINSEYPVLIWQTSNDRLSLINLNGSNNAFKQDEDGSIILSWQN